MWIAFNITQNQLIVAMIHIHDITHKHISGIMRSSTRLINYDYLI